MTLSTRGVGTWKPGSANATSGDAPLFKTPDEAGAWVQKNPHEQGRVIPIRAVLKSIPFPEKEMLRTVHCALARRARQSSQPRIRSSGAVGAPGSRSSQTSLLRPSLLWAQDARHIPAGASYEFGSERREPGRRRDLAGPSAAKIAPPLTGPLPRRAWPRGSPGASRWPGRASRRQSSCRFLAAAESISPEARKRRGPGKIREMNISPVAVIATVDQSCAIANHWAGADVITSRDELAHQLAAGFLGEGIPLRRETPAGEPPVSHG